MKQARMVNSALVLGCCLTLMFTSMAAAQTPAKAPPTPAEAITRTFTSLNKNILAMAEDWAADKYDFRLDPKATPPVRSFGEVIVHIMGGNIYAAKVGRGQQAEWDEVDPKTLNGKAAIVAAFKKSVTDAEAALKATPPEKFATSLGPWLSVIEHHAEHYGQLIAYYRANSIVPPSSRPRPKGSQD